MARLVVLRFEDDKEADKFADEASYGAVNSLDEGIVYMATVEGVFQTPTKFHEGHKSSGWRKSTKHGWWICKDCGAPSQPWAENIRAVIASGNDLTEKQSRNSQERIDMVKEHFDLETGKMLEES